MAEENIIGLHWSFSAVKKTIAEHGEQEEFTCASGVTPSGTIHIGNFREIITVDLVTRAFRRLGKKARHIHSWDDNDVFRKIPKNMPNQDMLASQLRKCIVDIPDPYGEEESYAAKHIKDVETAIAQVGITPLSIRQSKKYRQCDYAQQIKEALEKTEEIKEILNEYREEPLSKEWLPATVFCDACKKDTITSISYEGGYELSYACECGHSETFDFRTKGIAKLLWRVDWPMRWKYENVNFEPGGKDHSTAGGSYDTGKKIIAKIWNGIAPSYQMYDFISIKGAGGKISSSTGKVITLKDCLAIYEPEIIRYLFAGTRPNAEFAISFDADVIKIYEDYDKCERIAHGVQEVKEKEQQKQKMIYEFSQLDEDKANHPTSCPVQIGFRHISTILQIKNLDVTATYEYFKEEVKTSYDEKKLKTRIQCVKNWLELYADEQFTFSIKPQKDEEFFASLDAQSKETLEAFKESLKNSNSFEEMEQAIYNVPKEQGIEMSDFFKLCYKAITGKEKGPKLANFIQEIGKEKVISLL